MKRNSEQPSVLAQYDIPLKVDNKVSNARYYSTMVGGFRVEFLSDIGNLIEGDHLKVKSRVTNLNYSNKHTRHLEGYKFKYSYKDMPLTSITEGAFSNSATHEYTIQDPSHTSISDLHNIELEIEEKFKWWGRKIASSHFYLPIIGDEVAPEFELRNGEIIYSQNFPRISESVSDGFGKIDTSTFKATLSGQMEGDVTDYLVLETPDKGASYKISGSFADLYNEQGNYELHLTAEDFSGKETASYKVDFKIDRTKPLSEIAIEDNVLTNNPSFDIPVVISDESPTTAILYHNGTEVERSDSKNPTFNVTLTEGNNTFELQVLDAANNIAEARSLSNIALDTIPPILSEIKPTNRKIYSLNFNISGVSNEPLSSVLIDDKVATLNTDRYSLDISRIEEGSDSLEIVATDLAGNTTIYNFDFEIFLKLINIELVTLKPKDGRIYVVGEEGSARPGIDIDVSGGFFNSKSVAVDETGSFIADFDYASSFKLYAEDSIADQEENYRLYFEADTTFTGMVKDVNGSPLPGVKVHLVSSGQSAFTNADGIFAIPSPATGLQRVCIDATVINDVEGESERLYSKTFINVSLGNLERNVLEKIIYLAPILQDGSETEIAPETGAVVTSVHAPGFELEIPADTAVFPDGVPNKISVMELPADRTSIELLPESTPKTVYAMEPSGLKFTERVKLRLPNKSNFRVGTELAIMSKNSETGQWEPDGAAVVISEDVIETKDGEGISHFSDVYATPYGLQLNEYSAEHKPGMYTDEGGVETSIKLPTYKVMGKDFGVGLNYNSFWASPSVLVTNTISTPSISLRYKKKESGASASVTTDIRFWSKPKKLESQFKSSDINTDWMLYDLDNPPSKTVVSYSVDMTDKATGSYPASAEYRMEYETVTITKTKVKNKGVFGSRSYDRNTDITRQLQTIFPPALNTNLYLQNRTNSEYGRGWKLNVGEKILNPNSDQIVIEEASGKLTPYVLKNSVDTLLISEKEIEVFQKDNDGYLILDGSNTLSSWNYDEEINNILTINQHDIEVGVNVNKFRRKLDNDLRRHQCSYQRFTGKMNIKPNFIYRNGSNYLLAQNYAFFSQAENGLNHHVGKLGTPGVFHIRGRGSSDGNKISNYDFLCKQYSVTGCGTRLYGWNEVKRDKSTSNSKEACARYSGRHQYGKYIPESGYVNASLLGSKFNQIKDAVEIEAGVLLVADYGNNRVRKIDFNKDEVFDFAGNGQTIDQTVDGKALDLPLYRPSAITKDKFGNVYVASYNGYIRRIDPVGNMTVISGLPINEGGRFEDETFIDEMTFNRPTGLAMDNENGYLYVADTNNHRIVQLDLVEGLAKRVMGTNICTPNDFEDGKPGLNTSICSPSDIEVDSEGNLVFLDKVNKLIRRLKFNRTSTGTEEFSPLNLNDNSKLVKLSNGEFERIQRNGVVEYFSADGFHKSTTDRLGNSTSYSYKDGLLESVTDPKGGTTTISYLGGLISSIADPTGRTTTFSYNGNQLTDVSFPDGSSQSFEYFSDGRMEYQIIKSGGEIKYEYSPNRKLASITKPDLSKEEIIDSLTQNYVQDNYIKVKKVREIEDLNQEIEDFFNPPVAQVKDADGNVIEIEYDGNGSATTITDAKNRVTRIERDNRSRPRKITKYDGEYSEFGYNDFGDLISKVDSESGIDEVYTYDDYGNLLTHTNSYDDTRTNTYYLNGLLQTATDFNENTTTRTYRADGLVKTISNSKGETTTFTYDDFGNIETKKSPTGKVTTFKRDDYGNVEEKIDPNGVSTLYAYDEFNRLTSVTVGVTVDSPGGNTTNYLYDFAGNLRKITDPAGNETLFDYNLSNQLIKKTTPLGQVTHMRYDGRGNVEWEKDANGNEKYYRYDSDNLLYEKSLPDNTYAMSYDLDGNMESISDNDSQISFTYEKVGDDYLVSTSIMKNNGMEEFSVSYSYDLNGNRESMNTSVGNFLYSHDSEGRLKYIRNHIGEEFGVGYDSANRLKSISRPNGSTVYSYDDDSILTSINHLDSSDESIEQYIYGRDNIGNRKSKVTSRSIASYSYDDLNQLISVGDSESGSETFSYDDLGNRLTDKYGSYTYDQKSQRLLEDHQKIYTYDNNGNLKTIVEKGLSGNLRNLYYDTENRLVSFEDYRNNIKIKSVSYTYDALGRRSGKSVIDLETPSKSISRKYAYEGNEILAEFDEDKDLLGVYTHSTMRTDDVLSVDVKSGKLANSTGSYFYLKDALGSIVDITNEAGTIIQHYAYSSFGKILKIVDNSGNDITANPLVKTSYGFTNREHDSESGMMYYRARYMMPEIGRFIQEDPHPGKKKMPNTINNKYIYTLNNPLAFTDPSGKFVFTAAAILGSYILSSATMGVVATALVTAATTTAIGVGIAEIAAETSGGSFTDVYKQDNFWENVGVSFASNLISFGVLRYFGMIGKFANGAGGFRIGASTVGGAMKVGAVFGATNGLIQGGYYRATGQVSDSEALMMFGASTIAGSLTFGAAKGWFPKYAVTAGAGITAGEAGVYIYLPDGGGQE